MKRNKEKQKTVESDGAPIPIKRVIGKLEKTLVVIYTGTKTFAKEGQTYSYPQYSVCWYEDDNKGRNVRNRKRFAELDDAKAEGNRIADALAGGHQEILKMTPQDCSQYGMARSKLAPLNVTLYDAVKEYFEAREHLKQLKPVVPLNLAVAEFVAARKALPDGSTLPEAAKFFAKRNPANLEKRTVEQAVDEMLKAKAGAKRSEVHLKDLEGRLTRFAEAFPNYPLTGITGAMIQQFLDNLRSSGRNKLSLSGRSKVNFLRHIGALFRFCVKRKYLPKDAIDELEAVELPEVEYGEIHVFTPPEMREILTAARRELVPWLAIGAFAGLRSAEIARLDWRDVDLQERHITVGAGKAKTGSRRVVPISDNLFAWLEPHAQAEGKVCPFASWWNEVAEIANAVNEARKKAGKKANFTWHRNALRHSFCSYRLATTSDVARVSYEAGNSPQMIHKFYKQLVNPKQGEAWFGIVPDNKTGIIPMPKPMPKEAAVL